MRSAWWRSGAGRLRREDGITLVELAVTMLVMGIIATVFLTVLTSVQTSLAREENRSETMDQARVAMETMDRDIRSGSVLCAVPVTSPTNFGLSVYTQSNDDPRWIQYQLVTSTDLLQRRQYLSSAWTSWSTVATGVVNDSTAPFAIDTSATAGSRTVGVTLLVNANPDDATASSVKLAGSLSIRNQSTTPTCSDIPSG
jgi:type II secretory pathway pseudopilin PulG